MKRIALIMKMDIGLLQNSIVWGMSLYPISYKKILELPGDGT